MESVDTRDLKSLAFRGVPVQVWLRAPFQNHTSGSLAQSVEQRTFNPLVEGSNPSRPTNSFLSGDKVAVKFPFFYTFIYKLFILVAMPPVIKNEIKISY